MQMHSGQAGQVLGDWGGSNRGEMGEGPEWRWPVGKERKNLVVTEHKDMKMWDVRVCGSPLLGVLNQAAYTRDMLKGDEVR